ncbi:MAG: RNA polymerase sigma factor [Planctomycetota bacterium]|jgi:RNA polymerase sigma factor (sigma-70 family)
MPKGLSHHSDEELAQLCSEGIDAAERLLLERHMQAIYGLPQRAFRADEEELSGFLLYAVDRIRERHTFSSFRIEAGVSFSTWFGVVIRNLYLDYLRRERRAPHSVPLAEELPTPAEANESQPQEPPLLQEMSIKCRTLFKLLLANSYSLTPDELRWLSKTSGHSLLQLTQRLAEIEEELADRSEQLETRQNQLATIHWWKCCYERQLQQLEAHCQGATPQDLPALQQKVYERLTRRREQHQRLLQELSGAAGQVTTPYHQLAKLLNQPEGTVGSHLTRCRKATAQHLQQRKAHP